MLLAFRLGEKLPYWALLALEVDLLAERWALLALRVVLLALGTSILAEYMLLLAKRDYLEDLNALSFSPWRKASLFGFTCGWALLALEVVLLAKLVRYLRSGPVYLRSICFYLLNGIIWKI
jgi:hypothetical protein